MPQAARDARVILIDRFRVPVWFTPPPLDRTSPMGRM